MSEKYCGYYKSPIGMLKIVCSKDALLSLMLTEEAEQDCITNEVSEKVISQLEEYFRGSLKEFDIKIQPEGTEFQNKVWSELQKIPYGTTISYKELATRVGNQKASRAVGQANSKNVNWIVIPCHRVIGAGGELGGYAAGVERKRWLIEHEIKFRDNK